VFNAIMSYKDSLPLIQCVYNTTDSLDLDIISQASVRQGAVITIPSSNSYINLSLKLTSGSRLHVINISYSIVSLTVGKSLAGTSSLACDSLISAMDKLSKIIIGIPEFVRELSKNNNKYTRAKRALEEYVSKLKEMPNSK